MVLSEIHCAAKIITTDRLDFSIYRRFGRHRLPSSFLPHDLPPTAYSIKRMSIPQKSKHPLKATIMASYPCI